MKFFDRHGNPGRCRSCNHYGVVGVIVRNFSNSPTNDFFCFLHSPVFYTRQVPSVIHVFDTDAKNRMTWWELAEIRE